MLTAAVILAMVTTAAVAMAQGDECGGGGFAWGDWSVPINTILLILLALIHTRTRRRVEEVAAVTDKVKLRKGDSGGRYRNTDTERWK